MKIEMTPIGIIHSPFAEPSQAPIQAGERRDVEGRVEVFPEYAEGLDDLDGFDCVWLIWYCHQAGPWTPKVKPFLDQELRGVFATRAPSRPNPIAFSAVVLTRREENRLWFRGVDMIEGTPLLDIKPYLPGLDSRPECLRDGWVEGRRMNVTGDNRFSRRNSSADDSETD